MRSSTPLTRRSRNTRKGRRFDRQAPYSARAVLVAMTCIAVFTAGLSGLARAAAGDDRLGFDIPALLQRAVESIFGSSVQSHRLELSREYIYAEDRLLAVEDRGARSGAASDLAVWRPSSGAWWVMGAETSAVTNFDWGIEGDIPSPGDFDGDGKTDLSVYRSSSGEWWTMHSSDGSYRSVRLGNSTDIPAPADFDGDGKTDACVYSPVSGTWTFIGSRDGTIGTRSLGGSSEIPAPADFDGDGSADPAVWNPVSRKFRWLSSNASSVQTAQLPEGASEPVPADYDGDGRADPAARSQAGWVIESTLTGSVETIAWQHLDDIAVPNDYDGDGKTDIAVWRPSDGFWLIRNSSTLESRTVQFGAQGDIPVPAFYRR